ncbi:uncharacterized protein LOC128727851 [Anopheles nili]|uniref:uncharacterized protein LOC128727851 n=1 Tax=Anopheles nili TaxID=185578 RepID=UPI00237BB81F|nr:uncharacterized protein LOC128727851 [Anopheles nili]
MKLLEINDPLEVIPIGCRLLELLGLGRDDKFKLLYWVQVVFYLVCSIVPRVLMKVEDTVTLLRLGSELAFVSYLYSQILALYFRRARLYDLVDSLQKCARKRYSDNILSFLVESNGKINKVSIACCKYFMLAYVLYCVMPPVTSSIIYFRNKRNETGEQEEYIISTEMNLYYLDIRFNLVHYAIYTVTICLLTVTSALTLCTKDVFDVSVIRSTSMMFQVTAMQIRELQGRITQSDLNTIIVSHRDTLECAKKLQKSLNLSLLFQLTFCSAIWCLMLFYILLMGFDSRIMNVALLLVIVTIETYAYCTLGTQLTEKLNDEWE